jgi:hypothetical protein
MGGETTDTNSGASAAGVFNRVDVYDPVGNAWRLEASMATARHGIFPFLHGERIYVAGGGVQAGNSQTTVVEVFHR